ncbi:MAG: type II secretion system protein GspJ [Myxococcota bacterium]
MKVLVRLRARARGITLIEVMISLAVLSMMMVSVWSSFNGTLRAMEVSEEIQNRYSIVRNGLLRMETELSMAYLSHNRPPDAQRHFTLFEGRVESSQSESITFSAFAHLRVRKDANESDQSVIQYFLAPDPDDGDRTHLFRRESRRLTGDLPEDLEQFFPAYVLVEDVESFEAEYWDPQVMEWQDEWRTTALDRQPDRLPERVKIELKVKDGEDIVPFTTQVVLLMQEKINLEQGQ